MKVGDYVYQDHTEATALLVEELKNGSFKAIVHDWRGRSVVKSISGWYPAPRVVDPATVPDEVKAKINRRLNA